MPEKHMASTDPTEMECGTLDAVKILQKSIDTLAGKQKDYESALQNTGTDSHILRLLFADSASVIHDCIEMVSETAREYGIFIT